MRRSEPPLVVIAGPTASGKTALAVELAKQFDGEVVCADSRSIYRGMDLGTAKPTREEMRGVPHWGLDLVDPGEYFSASDFKAYADAKIDEIRSRGRVPFLVGGSGLYIDAVLFDYKFGVPPDPKRRLQLETKSIQELIDYCKKNNIDLPQNQDNKRYLVRAIENNGIVRQEISRPVYKSIVVGITTDKAILKGRIIRRASQIVKAGVLDEAKDLAERFGWQNEAMSGIVYRLAREYFDGQIDKPTLIKKFATGDWHLAKRQLTWLRRNQHIVWLNLAEAREYINSKLSN